VANASLVAMADGPSVGSFQNVKAHFKGEVELEGHGTVYAVCDFSADAKKLYLFKSKQSTAPFQVIDVPSASYSIGSWQGPGKRCLQLQGGDGPLSFCVESEKDENMWVNRLVKAGATARDDDNAVVPPKLFDISVTDMDDREVRMEAYRGRVLLIVNVASF